MYQSAAVIAGEGFKRVAESMAQIKQGAVSCLALVAGDNSGLGAAGGGDGLRTGGATLKDVTPVVFQPWKKEGLSIRPYLATSA